MRSGQYNAVVVVVVVVVGGGGGGGFGGDLFEEVMFLRVILKVFSDGLATCQVNLMEKLSWPSSWSSL